MSAKELEAVLARLVEDTTPRVLAVSGPWGVGKTFALRRMIEQYKGPAAVNRYSYASVFGAQTPGEIKTALMTRRQEFPVPTVDELLQRNWLTRQRAAARKWISRWSKRAGLRQAYESLRDALPHGGKNVVVAVESLVGAIVFDSLIVLDDIERLGKNLSLEHLMGFIAELRDEFRCRVIIVFNEDELAKRSDSEAFERYAEKVVDLHHAFHLTSAEAIEIGLPLDTPVRNLIGNAISQLRVTNLRVIQRIQTAAQLMFPAIASSSAPVHQQFATTICVCACSIYERARGFPQPSELLKYNVYSARWSSNQGVPPLEWQTLLRQVGFTASDDFDRSVMQIMQHGYMTDLTLSKCARDLDAVADGASKRKIFNDAWNLFHDSIDATASDVAQALFAAVCESAETISANSLDATVRLIRELGFEDIANQTIEAFIERRRGAPAIFDVEQAERIGDMIDPVVIRRFREEFLRTTRAITLSEAAARLVADEGWGAEILVAFMEANPTELVELLREFQGRHLKKLIAQIFMVPIAESERVAIRQNMAAALRIIANMSPLNAMRVKAWGYEPE